MTTMDERPCAWCQGGAVRGDGGRLRACGMCEQTGHTYHCPECGHDQLPSDGRECQECARRERKRSAAEVEFAAATRVDDEWKQSAYINARFLSRTVAEGDGPVVFTLSIAGASACLTRRDAFRTTIMRRTHLAPDLSDDDARAAAEAWVRDEA